MKVLILGLFFSNLVYADTQVYQAEARIKGKVVYLEKHSVTTNNNQIVSSVTEYTDPKGRLLGTLRNNYEKSLNSPEHLMVDPVHKNRHGVRYQGEELILYNQEEGVKEETKAMSPGEVKGKLVVGGQGLHYYLVKNMEEVIKKGRLDLKFLIPGRLDAYDFYLKVVNKTEDMVNLEIEIDNWLLRLFAPKLELVYSRKSPRLLKYRGLSNIKDKNKDLMNVDITYQYVND